jgi:hypothetical protein
VSTDGGEPEPLTSFVARAPSVSPDGQRVLCEFSRDPAGGQWAVGTIPIAGGPPTATFPDVPVGAQARWLADTMVGYVATRDGVSNLWVKPLTGHTAPHSITAFSEERIFAFAWSPVTRSVAYVRGVLARDVTMFGEKEEQR